MNMPPWFPGHALALDTETTAPEPKDAHLVSVTLACVSLLGLGKVWDYLVNAGVEIPAEATAIHGVTNERVKAEGAPIALVLPRVVDVLTWAWSKGWPVVVMNANYDLTVLAFALARAGLPPLQLGMILDPFVIDRACDTYRPGKRRLAELCVHHQVKQEGAHSSAGDALAAARVLWRQAEWSMKPGKYHHLATKTLLDMQRFQKDAHAARQEDYRQYLKREKKPQAEIDAVDEHWPIRGAA